jgi:hypothetical protein
MFLSSMEEVLEMGTGYYIGDFMSRREEGQRRESQVLNSPAGYWCLPWRLPGHIPALWSCVTTHGVNVLVASWPVQFTANGAELGIQMTATWKQDNERDTALPQSSTFVVKFSFIAAQLLTRTWDVALPVVDRGRERIWHKTWNEPEAEEMSSGYRNHR